MVERQKIFCRLHHLFFLKVVLTCLRIYWPYCTKDSSQVFTGHWPNDCAPYQVAKKTLFMVHIHLGSLYPILTPHVFFSNFLYHIHSLLTAIGFLVANLSILLSSFFVVMTCLYHLVDFLKLLPKVMVLVMNLMSKHYFWDFLL